MALKLVCVGARGTGKSELLRGLSPQALACGAREATLLPQCFPAAVDGIRPGGVVELDLWDSSGDPRLLALGAAELSGADVLMLTVDLSADGGLAAARGVRELVRSLLPDAPGQPAAVWLVVGTKVDLAKRAVAGADLMAWARHVGASAYVETAALTAPLRPTVRLEAMRAWQAELVDGVRIAVQAAVDSGRYDPRRARELPEQHAGRELSEPAGPESLAALLACTGRDRKLDRKSASAASPDGCVMA
jgi:hypothetical protein